MLINVCLSVLSSVRETSRPKVFSGDNQTVSYRAKSAVKREIWVTGDLKTLSKRDLIINLF